jgi:hypothetical protein
MSAYLEKDPRGITGQGYKLDLPDDPIQRRRIQEARRKAELPFGAIR